LRIYNFFDLDGSSIAIKEVYRKRYRTHDEIRGIVIDCVPIDKCVNLLGKEITILATELEEFVFTKVEIPRTFFRKDEIYVVSGTLKPYKGVMIFVFGLPYFVLTRKLSSNKEELYFRDMYYKAREQMYNELEKLKEFLIKEIDLSSKSVDVCRDIIKKYNELFVKTFGFIAKGPESLQAVEAALTLVPQAVKGPEQAAPSQPSKPKFEKLVSSIKSFFGKLASLIRGLVGRR